MLLATAEAFAVLAGSGVANTGPSIVNGDLGTSPTPAVTGFPPGIVNGEIHAANAVASQAQADLTEAYKDAAGRSSTATVSGDLGGRTLTPGVYSSASSLGLTGTLTLDAQGDPQAVFIFQAGSTLTTASGSRVLLTNGAQACNVFWQVGSSATLGTGSTFVGNILALTSISATTGATVDGRLLARNGAVTLDTNVITKSTCARGEGGGGGGGGDEDGRDGDDGDDEDGDNDRADNGDGDGDDDGGDSTGGEEGTPSSGTVTPPVGAGPSPAPTPSARPSPVALIVVSVTPSRVPVGRTVRFEFRAVTQVGRVRRRLPGLSIFFNGRRELTNHLGVATFVTRFTRPGVKNAYGKRNGMRPTTVRVVAIASRPAPRPRFTG